MAMKHTLLKGTLLSAAMLGTITDAIAHTQAGALGRAAEATDLYVVTCSDDGNGPPAHLDTQVANSSRKNVLVSVQTIKGSQATNSTDLRGGDVRSSRLVSNQGGAGAYYVVVNKAKRGLAAYTLQFHCVTGSGAHTGTEISSVQNQ